MTRRFVYRFRLIMFAWLVRRWPSNPFLFFLDTATFLFDVLLLWLLPATVRLRVISSYAVRLDWARSNGSLPKPPPWADHALKQALGLEP